jgi:hypothetical protein
MSIHLATETEIRERGMIREGKSHFSALHLDVGCLMTSREMACLFELFDCKGRLILGRGTRRKRTPVQRNGANSSRLQSFAQSRNPTRIY